MTEDNQTRTAFASKALQVTALFETYFSKTAIGGDVPRTVKVSMEVGESTGGGKMARESIMLVPSDGSRNGTLVVGWIDVGADTAELRMYEVLAAHYQDRYGKALNLNRNQYDDFLAKAQEFFKNENITTNVISDPGKRRGKAGGKELAKPSGGGNGLAIALVAGAAVILIGVVVLLLMKSQGG